MHVLIVGASRGIGLETARQALAAGHQVRALARSVSTMDVSGASLEKVTGDALNAKDMEAATQGVDVVVEALGVGFGELLGPISLFSKATQILIEAMKRQGVKRLIAVTGFGAGESSERINCIQRLPFQAVFGRAYEDKSMQEHLIRESGLDWTIARPGVLTPGPLTKRYRILTEPSRWRNGLISRADVADFLVQQIESTTYVGKAPVLVN
jgi:putative NADH-flavin reductase